MFISCFGCEKLYRFSESTAQARETYCSKECEEETIGEMKASIEEGVEKSYNNSEPIAPVITPELGKKFLDMLKVTPPKS